MLKVIAACGNGMGTSQIIKMKIGNVFKKLGIPVEVGHMSVGEALGQAQNYDVVFCSDSLAGTFKATPKTKIIGLKNLLSEQEIETKVKDAGLA
jgi:PTS system ascorbate-specific IIB component